jgi:hypothetical protein
MVGFRVAIVNRLGYYRSIPEPQHIRPDHATQLGKTRRGQDEVADISAVASTMSVGDMTESLEFL